MSHTTLEITVALLENLAAVRQLRGAEWRRDVEQLTPSLQEAMQRGRHHSAVAAAFEAAKRMVKAGENPCLLMAVATQIDIEADKSKKPLDNPPEAG